MWWKKEKSLFPKNRQFGSPDDHGEEEAGKENDMAIVINSEEVDVQEEKQLEDNNAVEAQPINMEAETTAEASQIQGQKPEENMNAEKPTVREEEISSKQKSVNSEDHTHPYQLRETELEERIQYIIGGNSRYSDSEDHIHIDRHLWEAGSEAHHTQFIIGGNPRESDLGDHTST
ncbi:hypothetical protein K7X08_006825 [Anisodus acutangulus]|uniref:Uncharacterized protein n=1 Tax=Anisodus acutangulus TaxID=402998 RepID=A0A9Q1N0H0_9SOLA|nr:hypothetical protein K7X08_006825 [Anisodus acutangulus]